MRREPTWAYRNGKEQSSQGESEQNTPSYFSNSSSLRRTAENSQFLYDSLAKQNSLQGSNVNRSSENTPYNNPYASNNVSAMNDPRNASSSTNFDRNIASKNARETSPQSAISTLQSLVKGDRQNITLGGLSRLISYALLFSFLLVFYLDQDAIPNLTISSAEVDIDFKRPYFVYEHPFVSSSYYSSTASEKTLKISEKKMHEDEAALSTGKGRRINVKTKLAIVRPFCEFDAEALPSTFACWDALVPCKTALNDLGDLEEMTGTQNRSSWNTLAEASADLFLFYSQSFADNPVAMAAVDSIINTFNEPGGWSQCFDNVYAIEANIPQELDLYIPSAQEELYNWVNGPNRQFEAAFRIIQSGEWGHYDAFYLMESDSIPVKSHWLDQVLHSVEAHRPFAILGAKYNGDKWDNFYESIPLSLLHHINGNAIYNTSHPLLERLVGQLEIEAPCPYNSIPYDYRMSQMITEGALHIVPKLAPKIMLNEEGENITLSNNTEMFSRWWDMYKNQDPFKETYVIHNYAATNLIPRHLGPEYIIHGAKLYSPWDPTKTDVTLVISEWFYDRSHHLLSHLDHTDHPFSKVIVMLPPDVMAHDNYNMTVVPVLAHHRSTPDYMDLCEAPVDTSYFMLTNSYHHVATHVDLMFTPGTFKPVTAYTPATYPFCFKFPYCKETINLAQRFNPGHDKVVQDFDMLYNTKVRNAFCKEWKERFGSEGEDLYRNQKQRLLVRGKIIGPKGPTGTAYTAYLMREGLDKGYKFTDRSLYGARDAFVKIFSKEEKLDGMSVDEMAKRVGVTGFDNSTDCDCKAFETRSECENSPLGCVWRPLFESCRPPEMIDDGTPICPQTDAPTMSPTIFFEFDETVSPTATPTKPPTEPDPWYATLFKAREHDQNRESGEITTEASEEVVPEEEEEVDTTEETDDLADPSEEVPVDDTGGRRRTEVISDRRRLDMLELDSQSMVTAIDSAPSPSPFMEVQRELFISSKLAYERNNSITHEIYVPDFENIEEASKYYLAPSASPAPTTDACPTWGPSIVQRSDSKKRKKSPFHNDFKDSNIPKRKLLTSASSAYFESYNMSDLLPDAVRDINDNDAVGTGLTIPNIKYVKNEPLDASFVSITNYRDRHPFEGGGGNTLLGDGANGDPFDNIRITFDTSNLDSMITSTDVNLMDKARIDAMLREILPSVSGIYSEALKVIPVFGNLFPASSTCGDINIPAAHQEVGVPNSDTVIYVTAKNNDCSRRPSQIRLCNFDQHMRPILGSLEICLDDIQLDQKVKTSKENALEEFFVTKEEMLHLVSHYTLEIGKMLGLAPNLFQFFRNPDTGRPWGTSPQSVTCVNGSNRFLDLPNILSVGASLGNLQTPTYEVISPTVLQVVRNHFDCQTMSGAALDSTDSSWSCFGSHWEKRLYFDEDWIVGTRRGYKSFSISPLTLALFEDSSWYKADFSKATSSSFGHGAGCGFVEGKCLVEGEVPTYSKGFFCNSESKGDSSGCDYTHAMKASCNKEESEETFTVNKSDTCPMMTRNIISCADESNKSGYDFEAFGKNSKCFDTKTSHSLCLETSCNKKDQKVEFMILDHIYQCDYDGQEIEIENGVVVECPRIAAVCPDMVCPSDCSGRGVCDYCLEVPQCICDDPFDDSPGCWNSQGW